MISKIDNKYNKKKAYKITKQVNVSLINFALGLILLSKISNYLMLNFLLISPLFASCSARFIDFLSNE